MAQTIVTSISQTLAGQTESTGDTSYETIVTHVSDPQLKLALELLNAAKRALLDNTPVLRETDGLLTLVRGRHNELRDVLTPVVQEGLIYANPEIFLLMEHINIHNLNPGELDLVLRQFGKVAELRYGAKLAFGGAGWGLTSRLFKRFRPDLEIYNADINPNIVSMDQATNRAQGYNGITSLICDFTRLSDLRSMFERYGPMDVASVGLLRYLKPDEREMMIKNLISISPSGTTFMFREVNLESMNSLASMLHRIGMPYQVAESKGNHFKFTRLFGLYAIYQGTPQIIQAIREFDPAFNHKIFKAEIDRTAQGYSARRGIRPINPQEILGDDAGHFMPDLEYRTNTSLDHLLVLADMAGYDTHEEKVVIFKR